MPWNLNAVEARVLGCLIEKQVATPDVYPLSLNSLAMACNQKSNRAPLMGLDEATVIRALDGLRDRKFASMISLAGSRVTKYEHQADSALRLEKQDLVLLCELLVRGPQTLAELRAHTERLWMFADAAEVERRVNEMMTGPEPLLVLLPRQPGRKEQRYAHLLCGAVSPEELPAGAPEPARLVVQAENERITKLEGEVVALREELARLQTLFADFRRQFE